eukprot:215763_1
MIVVTNYMAILFTDDKLNCIWRMQNGSSCVFPIQKISGLESIGGTHSQTSEWQPLEKALWREPCGICEFSYETFVIVDTGNQCIRVIKDCKYASAEVGLFQHSNVNLNGFEFNPQFVDCTESKIVLSNAQPYPCILIGIVDIENLKIDFYDWVVDNQFIIDPKCVVMTQADTYIVADFGNDDNSMTGTRGGVRYIHREETESMDTDDAWQVDTMFCVHKNHPFGVSMDINGKLHVSYPNEMAGNIVIVSNPFDTENAQIEYEIGLSQEQASIKTDGPYKFASVMGARSICCIGTSSFVVFPDKIKYIMDVSSLEYGLPKWNKLVRENVQQPFGIIDEQQKKLLSNTDFVDYVQNICSPNMDQTTQNIVKLNAATNEMGSMCSRQLMNINQQITTEPRKRTHVGGSDGTFIFNSMKKGQELYKSAKKIQIFMKQLHDIVLLQNDSSIIINNVMKLSCFTTTSIESFNGITATISGDLTKDVYSYAFARGRAVQRIYNF